MSATHTAVTPLERTVTDMNRYLLPAAVGVVVLLGSIASPVMAATNEPIARVCTIGTNPLPAGDDEFLAPEDSIVVESCFDDLASAVTFIEAGAPGDLEKLTDGAVSARATDVEAAATVILGRVYTGTAHTGSSNVYWGTGTGCNGATYGFPTLAAGWNNTIRSAVSSNGCWGTYYDGASYGGDRVNCTPTCSTMSVMAARTSSIVFRPAGTLG